MIDSYTFQPSRRFQTMSRFALFLTSFAFVVFSASAQDYGDAPDLGPGTGPGDYTTLAAFGGPSHTLITGPRFGALIDSDTGALQNATATADDITNFPDEDGITFPNTLVTAGTATTAAAVVNVQNFGGFVNAFIDFNQDGDFLDPLEQIVTNLFLGVGTVNLTFTIPALATSGTTIARFRIGTIPGASSVSTEFDGEIEDYQVSIQGGAGAAVVDFADGITQPITIERSGADVVVKDAGGTVLKAPLASITTLSVTGTSANDSFVIDYTGGDVAGGAISIDGSGQTGVPGDELTLNNGTQTTVTHTFTNANDGSISFTSFNTINYVGLEPVSDNMSTTNRVFTFTGGAETITLGDDGGAADNLSVIDSDLGESVTFDHFTMSTLTVNSGTGADNITLERLDTNYSGTIDINGDADADDLILDWVSGNPLQHGAVSWDGGAGANTFLLDNGAGFTTITHDLSAFTVDVDGSNLFSYISSTLNEDDLSSTNKIFNLTAGADVVAFSDDAGASDGQSKVDDGTVSIDYRDPGTATTVNGLAGNDDVTMTQLDDNYSGTFVFNGGDDDDSFIVDWTAGSPISGPTVTYNGNVGGTNSDALVLNDGAGIATVTHFFDSLNDGTVTVDGSVLTYTGLEPIDDNLTAATRTFTFDATADDITLDADFGVSDSKISSASTSESVTFSFTGLGTVVINGGGGSDLFDVEPTIEYETTVNGGAPTTLTTGDRFTLNTGTLGAADKVTLVEASFTAGTYSFSSGELDVNYTEMEIVDLRFSDPNALSAATYPGDFMYPIHTESGISIEPYFNWDIENWPAAAHPSSLTTLTLEVSLASDLSAPVFTTTLKEDGATALIATGVDEDHYVTDIDRDAGIVLDNDTKYYWGLTADMLSGAVFCQINWFTTLDDLLPMLDYPDDELTIFNLEPEFNWDVGSPTPTEVYWRMELDNIAKGSFVGDIPLTAEGLLMGEGKNDDDTASGDGYASSTEFDPSNLPTPLIWGTTYSWRVATMWPVPPTGWVPQEIFDLDETDRTVSISAVSQFQTVTKAVVPILTYPVDGLTIYDNEPILSWNVGGPFAALTFEIMITESGGAPVACTGSGLISGISGLQYDTASCTTPLDAGTTYEWKVKSTDGTSSSAFSGIETFSILGNGAASAATPSYPVGNLEIYTTAPTFHWYTGTAANGLTFIAWYKERLGAAETTCTGVKAGGTSLASVSVTQADVSGLTPGATYDWCVVTTGTNGSFDSSVASFSVSGGAGDGIPIASWPTGNPTTYSLDQIVQWYVEGSTLGITGYTVEYCISPDTFGDPGCTTVAALTVTQYEILGLSYGDIVTWRVKASYTTGSDSDWTVAASQGGFTVTGELSSLSSILTYPVGSLIVYDTDLQFNWYVNGATLPSGSLTFEVSWSYAESFPSIGTVTQTATTTDPYYDVTGLIPGHTYWWRVRISLDGGATYGSYSTVATFAVHAGASAVMPRLGSPTRAVSISTANPTLSWILPTQSTSTLSFELLVGQESDLSDAQVFEDISTTHFQVTNLAEGEYYWQVRSRTAEGLISPYSPIGSFTTTASISVGVEDEDLPAIGEELPDTFELGQNYPNPFNPTTTIEFKMAETAGVTIRVYNVLGQVVRTLIQGTLPSGAHRVTWDARDDTGTAVSSGLYLYRMETSAFTSVKTLVLMK